MTSSILLTHTPGVVGDLLQLGVSLFFPDTARHIGDPTWPQILVGEFRECRSIWQVLPTVNNTGEYSLEGRQNVSLCQIISSEPIFKAHYLNFTEYRQNRSARAL